VKRKVAPHPLRFRWTAKLVAFLGRLPDAEVALRTKTTTHTVIAERRRRRIPSFVRRRPNIDWTPDKLALLGTDTDARVAAELKVHVGSVLLRRRILGIPAFGRGGAPHPGFRWARRALASLGRASDRAVARRLGISVTTVCLKRLELGIPSYGPRPFFNWTPERLKRLGKRPDTELAREFGLNPMTVWAKRQALGIPRYLRRGRRKTTSGEPKSGH
jgi:hypothetical protein